MNAFKLIPVALCLVLVLLPSQNPVYAEEAADMFECANCHVMKIRDFKGRRATPITPVKEYPEEPSGVQDGASASGICW